MKIHFSIHSVKELDVYQVINDSPIRAPALHMVAVMRQHSLPLKCSVWLTPLYSGTEMCRFPGT